MTDIDSSATNDVFVTSRYAELVENPIMYSSQTILHLQLTEWKLTFILRLENYGGSITPEMKTMTAQKIFGKNKFYKI
jgi:hypothetical protein